MAKYRRTIIAALIIAGVWALLYLPYLRTSPGWYGDETLTLMIGNSFFQNQLSDRAIHVTFWHPSYAYQPAYAWVVGFFSNFVNGDIWGGRLLNAVLALTIALSILVMGQGVLGYLPAIFGSLVFLTYEQTIIHFRWIYSHNGVALGFVIALLALVRRSSPRANTVAGCGLAVAALCHPLFAHGCLGALLCRLKRPAAWPFLILPPLIVVLATVGLTLLRTMPNLWVLEDIGLLAEFYASFSREHGSAFQWLLNTYKFYSQDVFHVVAVICICICAIRKYYAAAILAAVVSSLLLQNRQNLPVFYYQAVVFLPILAVCYAGALSLLSARLRLSLGSKARLVVIAAFVFPAFMFIRNIPASLSGDFSPRNYYWVTQKWKEVESAADFVNSHTTESDLVICHQNIGWLLRARTADLMQVATYSGLPTFTFERPLKQDRFIYPAKIDDAKFIILADIDQRWTLGQPNIIKIVDQMQQQGWQIVWKQEYYIICMNPRYGQGS